MAFQTSQSVLNISTFPALMLFTISPFSPQRLHPEQSGALRFSTYDPAWSKQEQTVDGLQP
jgi:hypothetical protein